MTVRTRRRTGRLNLERTSWKKRATAVQYYALRHTGTWGRGGGGRHRERRRQRRRRRARRTARRLPRRATRFPQRRMTLPGVRCRGPIMRESDALSTQTTDQRRNLGQSGIRVGREKNKLKWDAATTCDNGRNRFTERAGVCG